PPRTPSTGWFDPALGESTHLPAGRLWVVPAMPRPMSWTYGRPSQASADPRSTPMGTTRHDLALDDLRAAGGRLLYPGDPGWDDGGRLWNGMGPGAPALVLQPRSPAEVADGVGFARDHGLALG